MKNRHIVLGSLIASMFLALMAPAPAAQAGYLAVYGGPTLDTETYVGFDAYEGSVAGVNNGGTAAATAWKWGEALDGGFRGVRWNTSGPAVELDNLGTDAGGYTDVFAGGVNGPGTTVGYANKYVDGSDLGYRALRWNAWDTGVTELGNLGTDSGGYSWSVANAVNDAGTAVGSAGKYVSGTDLGYRAVRWDASGTVATELAVLNTDSSGYSSATAVALNYAGTIVGFATKYLNGNDKGTRAVRWDASGTAITELGNLGVKNNATDAQATAVNEGGLAVGYAEKYVSGTDKGRRAVRWVASGTNATELGDLGAPTSGKWTTEAVAVNDAGTAVGYANKYVGGVSLGTRAVRWDASGTAATELGNLGTDLAGSTTTYAYAVSKTGTVVGYAKRYIGGVYQDDRAVLWGADAVAVDLNTLIDPDSGWMLYSASAISANGMWISGIGLYDPDGDGPMYAYDRFFTLQMFPWGDANGDGHVDATDYALWFNNYGASGRGVEGDMNGDWSVDATDYALWFNNYGAGGANGVPEPATLALLALGAAAIVRRRTRGE